MDIATQLRRDAYAPHFTSRGAAELMEKAADEIDRLRSALSELLDANRLEGSATRLSEDEWARRIKAALDVLKN